MVVHVLMGLQGSPTSACTVWWLWLENLYKSLVTDLKTASVSTTECVVSGKEVL